MQLYDENINNLPNIFYSSGLVQSSNDIHNDSVFLMKLFFLLWCSRLLEVLGLQLSLSITVPGLLRQNRSEVSSSLEIAELSTESIIFTSLQSLLYNL